MKDLVARRASAVAADKEVELLNQMLAGVHPSAPLATVAPATADPEHAEQSPKSALLAQASAQGYYAPKVPHAQGTVELMRDHLGKVHRDEQSDDAFAVADVGSVIRQHTQWVEALPRVEPFYAVKCNPDPMILQTMLRLGTGFDCASKGEIDAVLAMGVSPDRVIYANPCKAASQIRHASRVGVRMMTFDNADELHKVKQHHANPKMVLRILTDDSHSVCQFGIKFGAHPDSTLGLLQLAKELGVPVVGVSFHVGSGCMDARAFSDAVMRARRVFDQGAQLGHAMALLDIGGGFPGADAGHGIAFPQIVAELRPALDQHFPAGCGVKIISEPGRYYVSAAYTLAVNVHARRLVRPASDPLKGDVQSCMLYVNEGLYSAFNCVYFDHTAVKPKILVKDGAFVHGMELHAKLQPQLPTSIWGPTCDSMDVLTRDATLPLLDVGDWLYFDAMGAYTVAAASTFNGFQRCKIIWTNTEAASLLV